MKITDTVRGSVRTVGLAAVLLCAAGIANADPDPITAEPLSSRHVFDGHVSIAITQDLDGMPKHTVEINDASHIAVMKFTIQPGAVFPWHTHPGTVLINVTQGELVFSFAEGCVERRYGPGDALVDPGDTVHTSFNPSREEETVVVATLLGVPGDGPLTIPVEADEGAALDDQCGIDRADGTGLLSGY